MQVGDILRKKTHARVVTVRMNETVARRRAIDARQQYQRARGEGRGPHRRQHRGRHVHRARRGARRSPRQGAAGVNLKVSQLISVQQLVACSSTDSLEHVRHLMSVHHIRHLPVIDDFALAGVISMRDVSSAFDDVAVTTQTAA